VFILSCSVERTELCNARKECSINIRSLAWQDLIYVYRHRQRTVSLDSTQNLTHGIPLGLRSTLAVFNPRKDIFTGCVKLSERNDLLVAEVIHRRGERSARLIYLLPSTQAESPLLLDLLDGLTEKVGDWGAYNLLAELEEDSSLVDYFKRAGFSSYGWQRIWRLDGDKDEPTYTSKIWQTERGVDEVAVRTLFSNLVPPLAQAADPFSDHRPYGLVYHQGDDILAYMECFYGPQGIVLLPLIHPEVKDVSLLINEMIHATIPRLGRPVYLIVRSYQAWLENQLEELGYQPSNRQTLLAKRLVNMQRIAVPEHFALIEHRRPEPTSPLVNHLAHQSPQKMGGSSDSSPFSPGR
jgi:hypothetical protein